MRITAIVKELVSSEALSHWDTLSPERKNFEMETAAAAARRKTRREKQRGGAGSWTNSVAITVVAITNAYARHRGDH